MSTTVESSPPRSNVHSLQARLFHGFADPSRLAILHLLCSSPRTVGELVDLTGLSQSNTSNHLACLLDCGLVAREKQGRFAVYSLADERIVPLLAMADGILADHAAEIASCTRMDTPKETRG